MTTSTRNKFYKCTDVHPSLFHSKRIQYSTSKNIYFYITDRKSDQRLRTVVLGPITLLDLENELIKDHISRCVQYFLRMHVNEEEGTTAHDGLVDFTT